MSASIDHCIRKLPVHHFWTQRCEMHYAITFLEVHDRGPSVDMSVQSRWNDSAVQCLCPVPGRWKDYCVRQLATKNRQHGLGEKPEVREQNQVMFMCAEVGGGGEGGKGGYCFSIWGNRSTFWFADAWFINSSRHSRWVIALLSLCLSWISCIPEMDALA